MGDCAIKGHPVLATMNEHIAKSGDMGEIDVRGPSSPVDASKGVQATSPLPKSETSSYRNVGAGTAKYTVPPPLEAIETTLRVVDMWDRVVEEYRIIGGKESQWGPNREIELLLKALVGVEDAVEILGRNHWTNIASTLRFVRRQLEECII